MKGNSSAVPQKRSWSVLFSELRTRLLLLILLILIPALLLIAYTALVQGRLASMTAQQEALHLAELAASTQEQQVEGAQQLLSALAQLPVMHNGDSEGCNRLFEKLHAQYQNYTNLFVVDSKGDTYCTGIPAASPVNVAGRPWFQRAMQTAGFSVGDYGLGVVTKRPLITFSYPVFDESGALILQVGASLDLNWLSDIIQRSQSAPDTTLTVIDRSGNILLVHPQNDALIGQPFPNSGLVAAVIAQGMGTLEGQGIDATDELFGFSPLGKTNGGAYVIVGMSKAAAFAEVNRLLAQNLLGLGLAGLITLIIAWVGVNRLVVNPVHSLVGSAARLAAGDLETRVDARLAQSTAELNTLSNAFNQMAESLGQRRKELAGESTERKRIEEALRSARDGLEQRVGERTGELARVNQALQNEVLERQEIEKVVRDQREQLRVMLSSIGDAVIATDAQGRIQFMNPVAQSLTGWTQAEAIRRNLQDVFHIVSESDRRLLDTPVERVMRDGVVVGLGNHTILVTKEGREIPIDDSAAPIQDKDGAISGVILVFRDITERRRAEQAQQFLEQVSVELASSIQFEQTLKNLTRLAVPGIADWCSIYLRQPDGSIEQVAVAHVDPEKVQWALELQRRYPPNPDDPTGVPNVIRTGEPEFYKDIPDEMLVALALDEELLRIIRDVGFSSAITVPIATRDAVLGALSLVSAESGRRYTETDLALAQEVAHRAAIALENARLYQDTQDARQAAERTAERITRLQTVTAALVNSLNPPEVAHIIVEQCIGALEGAYGGMVSLLTPDQESLETLYMAGYTPQMQNRLQRLSMSADRPLQRAVRSNTPIFIESKEAWRALFPAMDDLVTSNSLALLPLAANGRSLGGMAVSFSNSRDFDADERAFLRSLAEQCAQALDRAQLYQIERQARTAAETARRQLDFLAQSGILLGSSLEYESILKTLLRLSIPILADWSAVDLLDKDNQLQPFAVEGLDAQTESEFLYMRTRFYNSERAGALMRIIQDGQPVLVPEVTEAMLRANAADEAELALMLSLHPASMLYVPLYVRGKPLGALNFVSSERRYTEEDLSLGAQLGRRAALAIDNALLYREAREQQERLQVTLSSIGDAVIATDARGGVTFINPVAQSLTGWPQADAFGKELPAVFHIINENTRQLVENPVEKVVRLGTVVGLANHTILIARDGREIPIDDSGAPILDENGAISGVILVFRDITERKRTEGIAQFLDETTAILAASLDYETTLENVAQLAVPRLADFCTINLVQENGEIWQAATAHGDPAKAQIVREVGRRRVDHDAQHGSGLVIRTDKPEVISDLNEIIEDLAGNAESLRVIREAGMTSYIAAPLIASGRTLGVIVFTMAESGRRFTNTDLPVIEEVARRAALAIENARLYRQAQEAVQARDEFLSIAAHELKTPVTSLRGFTQLLLRQFHKRGTFDPAQMERALTVIDEQSVKLTALVMQLLDLARLEAGRLALEPEITDLVPLVNQVAVALQRNTALHTISVEAPGALPACLDPLRLEQVLVNLLDNAIKYSPDGGPITVNLSMADGQTVRLSITDQGIGIPLERRQRIFERFYQAHQEGYRGGMGLGLYVSRQIIELHGGQIVAEYPPEGGTRFVITLPMKDACN